MMITYFIILFTPSGGELGYLPYPERYSISPTIGLMHDMKILSNAPDAISKYEILNHQLMSWRENLARHE